MYKADRLTVPVLRELVLPSRTIPRRWTYIIFIFSYCQSYVLVIVQRIYTCFTCLGVQHNTVNMTFGLSTSCRAYTSQAFIHVDVNEGNHKAGLPRRCIETGEFEQTVLSLAAYIFLPGQPFLFYHVTPQQVWKWFYTVGLGGYLSVHTEKMIWSKHHVELVIVSETLFLGKENERSRIAVPPVSLCRLSGIRRRREGAFLTGLDRNRTA